MPRYFFDLFDDTVTIDDVGYELADLDAARRLAVVTLTEVASEVLPSDGPAKHILINVRNDEGDIVLSTEMDFKVRFGG